MRLAVYQCASSPLDVAGNLRRLEATALRAAEQGADLLVCPEMFLTGYNIGAEAVSRLAEPCDGPSAQVIARIAQAAGVAILYGYPERAGAGLVYNAVQLIDAQGQRLGNYRKTHLYGELDHSLFSRGEALDTALIEWQGWHLGLLICYDVEFPENTRRLALAGADLVLVPTANMLPYDFVATTTVRARAYENQFYLAYGNYCAAEGDITYCGLSSVSSPDGTPLAQAGRDEELLLADLDRRVVEQARQQTPYLQDRRPELYGALTAADRSQR
ncbi:carbon-nitrogen hydrolase [Pseudomonas cavernicola]|uniref:Carbon-nitrogen hydrolase n=1 Tax=Pseudomonas cavernicola TaxID=2320866 RepID=A0A418XDK6_9PSED|nr:carbon-nitrogen hydrolase family protein [Pseudomonas cavernicola]RJG10597.1 carbon-nitrogen hydrolase [Pseudomonas cavernicola]RJG10599.1 carbon-nitrogen hydrolase [Pseudomonas cavernicola]